MALIDYEARLRRVVQHIHDNPAADLSLDALADVAAMSRFHWHRVFFAMTGETCAQAVRRIRAHRAAHWLVQTDWPVNVIAARSGHRNAQSFSRSFRAHFGVTPAVFRSAGVPGDFELLQKGDLTMAEFEIRSLKETRLAALPHIGAYTEIGAAFQQVAAVFTARGLWSEARGMVGVYHSDPSSVPETDLRSHAGVIVGMDVDMPDALEDVRLPAGPHAVSTYTGPYAGLPAAWDALYGRALPASGRMPSDLPSFEIYLNDPTEVPPEALVTEICVPLVSDPQHGDQ
ncbi:AraC family transcriptional regulator [Marivita hallyeonensis]|uniref:Transcriptional regulator, AraC family n=1 Tax=Marivita hallyeonensis TaxID=996342 RepID=A0A1M5X7F8_9RHOB|nr:AraC family transcriptional regulator [Marivita hallyeonensis]SHH95562.1 transcriptional regulator, AraC family [Marivita hallyeonensis]